MSPHPEIVQAMGMPSGFEWLVILIIALMLFGNKLPSVMRNLGGSVREFKKGMEVGDDKPVGAAPPQPTAAPVAPAAPEGAISRGSPDQFHRDQPAAPAPGSQVTK